jgi:hypothetical protein
MDKGNNNSRVEEFAKNINKFFGRIFIPFTTPFFALYNCFKLMEGVENKCLKIMIFVVSMIYVVMSLVVAIYVVIIKKK